MWTSFPRVWELPINHNLQHLGLLRVRLRPLLRSLPKTFPELSPCDWQYFRIHCVQSYLLFLPFALKHAEHKSHVDFLLVNLKLPRACTMSNRYTWFEPVLCVPSGCF